MTKNVLLPALGHEVDLVIYTRQAMENKQVGGAGGAGLHTLVVGVGVALVDKVFSQ